MKYSYKYLSSLKRKLKRLYSQMDDMDERVKMLRNQEMDIQDKIIRHLKIKKHDF